MRCPNCGNQINDDAIFCTYCGVKIPNIKEEVKEGDSLEDKVQANEDVSEEDNKELASSVEPSLVQEPVAGSAESTQESSCEVEKTVEKKKFNIKVIAIVAAIFIIVMAGGVYSYNRYMNSVLSSKAYYRDYSIIGDETIAFNYVENISKGELYTVKNGKGTKIADNVKPDIYYANPVKDFVLYQTNEGTGGKTYIYKDGKSTEFNGEFYKYTPDGKYMLYTENSKLYIYDCETGKNKKIASSEGDKSLWWMKYDGKNKIVYVCLGDKNRVYKVSMADGAEAENIARNVESFDILGLNSFGYKKVESDKYELKTQNVEDTISLSFTDINEIESSMDGETIFFTATKDEEGQYSEGGFSSQEYALYVMVEGNEEPVKLLSGPVYGFEYKEDINKIYACKDESIYSIDVPARTRKNKKDKEVYYNALNECEPQKIESDVANWWISPDGSNILAIKSDSLSNKDNKKTETSTEAATTAPGEPKGALLSNIVYAEEATTKVADTAAKAQTTEAVTEANTEKRVVGDIAELVIIRGDEKESVDISSSIDLCLQYLRVSDNSVVYPLAVNGKVELHIIKNIDKGLDSIDNNDEILCSNTGLFNFDDVKNELIYFDKNTKTVVKYKDYKKSNEKADVEYDLIYLNSGSGFDGVNLAYRKIPDYNTFVGKYKLKSDDKVLKNVVVEFTADKQMKVYAIGEVQGTTPITINEGESNRTALRVAPKDTSAFEPKCNPYYDHSKYDYTLLSRTIMSDNSLLIADFDNTYKYKLSNIETIALEKLDDKGFNDAISSQKSTHNNNMAQLRQEKAAAEAAAAEAARREALDETAMDYYWEGVYVSSSEYLYSWHSRSDSTTNYFIYGGTKTVYDYYIDYNSGDIWLEVHATNDFGYDESFWVVR